MAKMNAAFSALRRHESLLDPSRPGYTGRLLLEAYGEWPSNYGVGITAEGPGLPNTWPRDEASRQVHATEIEHLASILRAARDPILKGEVPMSPLPAEARDATPFVKPDAAIAFAGRAVIESWASGHCHLSVETSKDLTLTDQCRFSADCIDKVLQTLTIRAHNLRTGRKH